MQNSDAQNGEPHIPPAARGRRRLRRLLPLLADVLWLALLGAYVLAGTPHVPFHGDESTLITMSADYYNLVQRQDPAALYYRDPAALPDPSLQQLRILNGTLSPLLYGFAWDMAGFTVDDLNEQYVWEWTLEQNRALGHVPPDDVLRAARWASAWLTVLAVIGVFGVTRSASRVWGGSRAAAWLAALLFATHPAVLLNGRRAMFEGGLFAFSLLTVWAALVWANSWARAAAKAEKTEDAGSRRLWLWAILLGLAAGLAAASKHTAALVIVAVFAALLTLPSSTAGGLRRMFSPVRLSSLALAALLTGGVFLAWNAAWWRDPLPMPGRVLDARRDLLDGQVAYYGGYDGVGERIERLLAHAFTEGPHYYEVPEWAAWIGGEIDDYEATGLAGRFPVRGWGLGVGLLFALGLLALGRRWRDASTRPGAWVLLVWAGTITLGVLILTPLDWQRYYLPLQPPIDVVAGLGGGFVLDFVFSLREKIRA